MVPCVKVHLVALLREPRRGSSPNPTIDIIIKLSQIEHRRPGPSAVIGSRGILNEPFQDRKIGIHHRINRGCSIILRRVQRIMIERIFGSQATRVTRLNTPANHLAILQSRQGNVRGINTIPCHVIRSHSIIQHFQRALRIKFLTIEKLYAIHRILTRCY